MKRPIILILAIALVAALASPTLAFAAKGSNNGKAAGKDKTTKSASVSPQAPSNGSQHSADAKAAHKDTKTTGKNVRGDKEVTDAAMPTESTESTKVAGPGVTNAFSHITRNIEKSLAKIAAGTKKQVPPGLLRVWLKFAGWLGVDPSTMPGATDTPDSDEPTGTVEPTSTVEPTGTVEPTSTIEIVVPPAQ